MPFENVPKGRLIITPDDPIFAPTLHTAPPPGWVNSRPDCEGYFVVSHETGLLRPANEKEVTEYLLGGEYDLQCPQPEDDEDCIFI